jgi:hypothetical protein
MVNVSLPDRLARGRSSGFAAGCRARLDQRRRGLRKRVPVMLNQLFGVMAGLVPAIYVLLGPRERGRARRGKDVDARDKRGHDDRNAVRCHRDML